MIHPFGVRDIVLLKFHSKRGVRSIHFGGRQIISGDAPGIFFTVICIPKSNRKKNSMSILPRCTSLTASCCHRQICPHEVELTVLRISIDREHVCPSFFEGCHIAILSGCFSHQWKMSCFHGDRESLMHQFTHARMAEQPHRSCTPSVDIEREYEKVRNEIVLRTRSCSGSLHGWLTLK